MDPQHANVAYAEAVYPNSPINKKLMINVIDTPMLEIQAPKIVLFDNLYQIDKLVYIPKNIFAPNKIGTTLNPSQYSGLLMKYLNTCK